MIKWFSGRHCRERWSRQRTSVSRDFGPFITGLARGRPGAHYPNARRHRPRLPSPRGSLSEPDFPSHGGSGRRLLPAYLRILVNASDACTHYINRALSRGELGGHVRDRDARTDRALERGAPCGSRACSHIGLMLLCQLSNGYVMRTRGAVPRGIPLPAPCRPGNIPLPAGVRNLAQEVDITKIFDDDQGVLGVEIDFLPAGREKRPRELAGPWATEGAGRLAGASDGAHIS